MGIAISTQLIHDSIAQILHEISPDAEIFDNPNQQGTPYPAWFIVHRSPTEIRKEIRRFYLTYYIDIWYMIKQNVTQMFDKYTLVAEQLMDKMVYIPLFGYPGVVLHTFETSWSIEMTAMKYSITIRLICSHGDGVDLPKMDVIEDFNAFVKGLNKLVRVYFTNTTHPELAVQIPDMLYAYKDEPFKLPIVGGIYRDENGTYLEPIRWSIGGFGDEVVLDENTTTDLVFEEIPVAVEPIGVAHGEYAGVGITIENVARPQLPTLEYITVGTNGDVTWGGMIHKEYGQIMPATQPSVEVAYGQISETVQVLPEIVYEVL